MRDVHQANFLTKLKYLKILIYVKMHQRLYTRVAAGNTATGGVSIEKTIRKNLSYGKYDRDVIDAEKFLMKKLNCGFTALHKHLIMKEIQNHTSTVSPVFRRG